MYRAVIVEDEQNSRELLRKAIKMFSKDVEIVGEADTVASGIRQIKKKNPDLIFLDIDLPDGQGFDVLDKFTIESFKVIFVTAYDDYAIKAIKYAAFDYILKPINFQELIDAINRLNNQLELSGSNLEVLKHSISANDHQSNKLIIPSHTGYAMINLEEICAIIADGKYVFFVLNEGKKLISSYSLSYYEEILPPERFYRVHKSHIINIAKVESVDTGRMGSVHLQNKLSFVIAARRKSAFLALLKKYN